MRNVLAYLKYRAFALLLYLAAVGIVLVVGFLSGLPMHYFYYIVVLLSFLLVSLVVFDARRFHHRVRDLRELQTQLILTRDLLPEPGDAVEREWAALAGQLGSWLQQTRSQLRSAQSDTLAYYTLWVHQIKTPISAMELVLRDMDDARAGVLRQELLKIEQYTEMALRYARLTDIASDLLPEPCDLDALVREAVKRFSLLFVYRKLTVEIGDLGAPVVSCRKWLPFILEQVISNAVKYTVRGGVRITRDGDTLTIADTGIGIRKEDLPRIFDRGYTGYNGRLDSRATGLGLYLCRRAADALCLSLSVESTVGVGTSVRIAFPPADTFPFQT